MSAPEAHYRIIRARRRSEARGVLLQGAFAHPDIQAIRAAARAILIAEGEESRGEGYVVFDNKPDSVTVWFK